MTGSDRPLEPQIFVRQMIFIMPKGHSYNPENFRSEAYVLNQRHFFGVLKLVPEPEGTAKNPSDAHF